MASRQKQLQTLGVGVDSYQGLIVLEIDGPPVVALTPPEARRFLASFQRAYVAALGDRDVLVDPRNLRSAQDEMVPDGTYGGARKVRWRAGRNGTASAGGGER